MYRQFSATCYGRRAGFTEAKKVGVFPAATARGDQVAALFGGRVLYVLRPLEHDKRKYSFVGECYVDGLMDGEGLNVAVKRGVTPAMLVLV